MALSNVTVSQTISWDYDACIQKTYRIQGACSAPVSSCNLPCPANQQYVVNITACTVSEACSKLIQRGFAKTIQSIQVFNAPVEGPFTGELDCLTDITPTLQDCQNCCDLLIDESLSQQVKIGMKAIICYLCQMSGIIGISGDFGVACSSYQSESSGNISLVGLSGYSSNGHLYSLADGTIRISGTMKTGVTFVYQVGGVIQLTGGVGVGFAPSVGGNVNVYGDMNPRFGVSYGANGNVFLTSSFDIVSSSYYHIMQGLVDLQGYMQAKSSYLGTIDFITKTKIVGEEMGVVFDVTTAPIVTPSPPLVTSSCCSSPIPASLNLSHNLDGLMALSRFLLRNNLNLPGTGGVALPLQYSPRFGAWRANLHYNGQSADVQGGETWNILFELLCSNQSGGSFLPSSVWQFMMFIKKTEDSGESFIIRLLALFDSVTFCPSATSFNGFTFQVNTQNQIATPSSFRPVILFDEALLLTSSPSFINNPELDFAIKVAGVTTQITDFSLNAPYQATLHVADNSGYPR